MLKIFKILCLSTFLLVGMNAHAQLSVSPYTTLGIGEINGMGLISNESLGGVGIAYGRPYFINNVNPALLPLNSITSFDIALLGERRVLSQGELSQTNSNIDFGYLAFAFPVIKGRNTISFGLKPYSTVNYDLRSTQRIIGSNTDVDYTVNGTGGINQAYFATGVRLFKGLFIGGRAAYFFGSTVDETTIDRFITTDVDTTLTNFKSTYFRRNTYSDAGFALGMAYAVKLNKDFTLSIGSTVDLQTTLSGKRLEKLDLRNTLDNVVVSDTLSDRDDLQTTLPAKYGLGFSMENGLKWATGIDFTYQDWSDYKNYSGETENLKKSYRLAVGGEFIPDYTSVTSYFKRALYRVGGYYGKTPYSNNNVQVSEFGINFGVGLPMREGSLINLMFGYGQRGFGNVNLIKEDIYKISLGITFNDSGWFHRRKYN